METSARYDMLEVVFLHAPRADQARTLSSFQEAVEPRFEVEALEYLSGPAFNSTPQILRIASAMGEQFGSAAEIDAEIRELAGDGFVWSRVGAIRAGQGATVRG